MAKSKSLRYGAVFPFVLLTFSLSGLLAAFSLTVEKINQLKNPGVSALCDFSLLVQCGANLNSWQGEVFGFPNPLLGIIGWSATIVISIVLALQTKLPRWFIRSIPVGLTGAFLFTVWLMYVSFFQLGTLCPWCMVTWLSTIVLVILSWIWSFRVEAWSSNPKVVSISEELWFWSPSLVLLGLLIPALVAQFRLDWVSNFFF